MAINYTNLFTVLGKYVKSINVFDGKFSALDTQRDDIVAVLESNSLNHLVSGLPTTISNSQRNIEQWIPRIISEWEKVLLDEDYVLKELANTSDSVTSAFYEIMSDFIAQSELIDSVVATAELSTAFGSGNHSLVYMSAKLGHDTSIANSVVSKHPTYDNRTSRMLSNEAALTIDVKCTNPTEGSERFSISARTEEGLPYTRVDESPGTGGSLGIATSDNVGLKNPNFEEFTSTDLPDNWTIAGQTAGTDFAQYNVAYQGIRSLAVKTTLTVSQAIDVIPPGKPHLLSFRLGHPDLVSIIDTNPTHSAASASCSITYLTTNNTLNTVTSNTSSTSAGLWKFVSMAFTLPEDFVQGSATINLIVSTLAASNWTLIDEVVLTELSRFDNLGYAVLRGDKTEVFATDDTSSTSLLVTNSGVFQQFFRKAYGIQLDASASPTIADTLAT